MEARTVSSVYSIKSPGSTLIGSSLKFSLPFEWIRFWQWIWEGKGKQTSLRWEHQLSDASQCRSPEGQCSQYTTLGSLQGWYGSRNENVPSTHTRNSENVPHGLRCEHLVPCWWRCLGRFRRYRFAGEKCVNGDSFEISLLLACAVLPAMPATCCHNFLSWWTPTAWNLILLCVALVMVFYHSNRK